MKFTNRTFAGSKVRIAGPI